MGRRQIIAIDVDDVLSQTAKAFIDWSNREYGLNLTVDDYQEDWGAVWGVDTEERERRAKYLLKSPLIGDISPVEEAGPVLEKLSKQYELAIITSRRSVIKDITIEWINKYFPGIFSDKAIYFAGMWDNITDESIHVTKSGAATKLGVDFLIDDQLKHCLSAAEHGIQAILMGDYKWNHSDSLPRGVTRVKNWGDIGRYFDERL
jgi:5'(3')-deoxyribonucleotidase